MPGPMVLRSVVELTNSYWRRTKFYGHTSGRPKYECKHQNIGAAETNANWAIWKMSDANLPTIEGPRFGRVDSEANIDADHSWET